MPVISNEYISNIEEEETEPLQRDEDDQRLRASTKMSREIREILVNKGYAIFQQASITEEILTGIRYGKQGHRAARTGMASGTAQYNDAPIPSARTLNCSLIHRWGRWRIFSESI